MKNFAQIIFTVCFFSIFLASPLVSYAEINNNFGYELIENFIPEVLAQDSSEEFLRDTGSETDPDAKFDDLKESEDNVESSILDVVFVWPWIIFITILLIVFLFLILWFWFKLSWIFITIILIILWILFFLWFWFVWPWWIFFLWLLLFLLFLLFLGWFLLAADDDDEDDPELNGTTPIQRGLIGNYRVDNATFSQWKFVGSGVTIDRPGNNNISTWSGVMVQSGTIHVRVRKENETFNLSLDVVVTARLWDENTPNIPLNDFGHAVSFSNVPRQPHSLAKTVVSGGFNTITSDVDNGPNLGFNWIPNEPVTWNVDVFTNNVLRDRTHPFYRAHTRNPLPRGRVSLAVLLREIKAHEGLAVPVGFSAGYASHWQLTLNHLAVPANQINIPLEADVKHISIESSADYQFRVSFRVVNKYIAADDAGDPEPVITFGPALSVFYDYPYITPRNVTLRVPVAGVPPVTVELTTTNMSGGPMTWVSANPAVATINVMGPFGTVTPVGAGTTTITVTNNSDGDFDEIQVTVNP